MSDRIELSINKEDKEWLKDHPEINASGLFRSALRKMKTTQSE